MANSNMALIKEFFSVPGRVVSMSEIKELSSEEREELGSLIIAELAAGEAAKVAA